MESEPRYLSDIRFVLGRLESSLGKWSQLSTESVRHLKDFMEVTVPGC